MSAFGRPLCEGGIIEQQSAQKHEVKLPKGVYQHQPPQALLGKLKLLQ